MRFRSARDSLAAGIGMVHQELSIVPDLTVAENVYLGKQPVMPGGIIDWRAMVRGAREQLADLGIDVDPKARMGALPIGLQQLIELARVLFSGRPHRHSRRADLGAVAAGGAAPLRRAAAPARARALASSSSRISSTTSCRSPTPSRSSATAAASSDERRPDRSTRAGSSST